VTDVKFRVVRRRPDSRRYTRALFGSSFFRLLPALLPSRWTTPVPYGQLWNVGPAQGPHRAVLDDVPTPRDQMLPEVSACPLRARSGGKTGELTVIPGEANPAPHLGRTSSPGAGRRPSTQPVVQRRFSHEASPGPRSYSAVHSGRAAAKRMILWPGPSTRAANPTGCPLARAEPLPVQSMKQPQLDLRSRLHNLGTYRVKAPGQGQAARKEPR
jgi:hypothetical protein